MSLTLRESLDISRISRFFVRLRVSTKKRGSEVLPEEVLRRILCWERKKAERSGRRFLLMLLYVKEILLDDPSGKARNEIALALSSSARETDAVGWYVEGSILGVIFTELGERGWDAFEELTRARVRGLLGTRLSPAQAGQVRISFYSFPNGEDKAITDSSATETLYPDVFEEKEETKLFRFVKRIIDIAGSTVALILCSPLFAVISAAIKLTSKGPVLFKQERVGQYGARFTFLKFRSMELGNDPRIHREYVKRFISGGACSTRVSHNEDAVYKIQDDPRITRVGRILRKTSLDELPQFLNVLQGHMSLVGPRPPIPYELEGYQAWHRRRMLEVKPGITGLWQVSGRSKTTFDEMVRLDLRYARAWSPWLDLKILLQTPRVLFFGDGAC